MNRHPPIVIPPLSHPQGMTLAKHLAVVCAIIPLIMIVTYAIMYLCDLVIPMRVSEEDEHIGLDISCHNETHSSTHKLHRPILDMDGPRLSYAEIGLTMSRSQREDELDQSVRAEQPKTMLFVDGNNKPSLSMRPTKNVSTSDLDKPGFATEWRNSQLPNPSLITMPLPPQGAVIDERAVPPVDSV